MTTDPDQTIAVAASFTAEPVEASLRFWMDELRIDGRVEFAPYNQLFQQLLDAGGLFYAPSAGLNVVLLRFEDWMRVEGTAGGESGVEQLAAELIDLLGTAADRATRPLLVVVCPSSPEVEAANAGLMARLEDDLAAKLRSLPESYLVTSSELLTRYPVPGYYDARTAGLGDVPYTPLFFAALGTMIARFYQSLRRPGRKVIALDCDMTLWRGICGEDGARGVEIDGPRRALQRFMVARHDEGMLLCLCSKNDEPDVLDVFDQRGDMPLRTDHVVASRINWSPKSDNLSYLAQQLGVGLDAFIFVDDDPLECAAVEAVRPEVLTLQLPRSPERIVHFLEHVWAFDRFGVTDEDRRRTSMYRAESERIRERDRSTSLAEFLDGLDLEVDFRAASREQLGRAAQLTFRTNQMNLTTVRRSETDLRNACAPPGLECVVVDVRDRFGDYGTVGVMLFSAAGPALETDTFLLSCRALGRGVEHRMVARLGTIAGERGLDAVVLRYRPSPNNGVAAAFCASLGADARQESPNETRYALSAAAAERVRYVPDEASAASPADLGREDGAAAPGAAAGEINRDDGSGGPSPTTTRSRRELTIARELSTPEAVLEAVLAHELRTRPESATPFAGPRNAAESELVKVWSEVLGVDRIGVHDNFFGLGGDSLSLTRIIARLPDVLGVPVSFEAFFDSPTIAGLARIVARPMEGSRAAAPAGASTGSGVGPGQVPASPPPAGAAISTLGVVTRGRPELMERGLASYVENAVRHGRSCRYLVVDDSESVSTRQQCRELLGRLARRSGVRIDYAGREEKQAYARRLVEQGGMPAEVARFALFGGENVGPTPGANRNAMLLDTIGEQVLSADDDTVCRIATAPVSADGVGLAAGRDPSEYWFFPDRQTALGDAAFVEQDLLALHEGVLGHRVADLVDGNGAGPTPDTSLGDAFRARLDAGDGSVAVSFSGLLGDCGLGAPFGFWIGPMGPMLLDEPSHERVVRSEDAYRTACSSREIRRAVRQTCISDHTFSMSTFMGLDNRASLPPVIPVQRGEDLVFGTTLWTCLQRSFFAHVPWTLLHAPEGRRSFWPGEMLRTASGIDTARLMIACIEAWRPSTGVADPSVRLRGLGEHLVGLGALPADEFAGFLRAEIGASSERFATLMEAALEHRGESPDYWARDLRRYLDRLRAAKEKPDYIVPLDLRIHRARDRAADLARRLVGDFGRLLTWWPAMREAAADLQKRGFRVAAPVS